MVHVNGYETGFSKLPTRISFVAFVTSSCARCNGYVRASKQAGMCNQPQLRFQLRRRPPFPRLGEAVVGYSRLSRGVYIDPQDPCTFDLVRRDKFAGAGAVALLVACPVSPVDI